MDTPPTLGHCKTCRYWQTERTRSLYDREWPRMGRCEAPEIARPDYFGEGQVEDPIAAVQDASDYRADLYTTGMFGCVLWKAVE